MNLNSHLFILDPLDRLNLKLDSSLKMAYCLKQLNQNIYVTTVDRLSLEKTNNKETIPLAKVAQIKFHNNELGNVSFESFKDRQSLTSFKNIYMRKDPPFDDTYLFATWILDHASNANTKVVNHPKALRDFNEKLSLFYFKDLCDDVLVSQNKDDLFDFFKSACKEDAILKPLDLFGGHGVERISREGRSDGALIALFDQATKNGHSARIIQPFNKGIYDGEVRCFLLDGEPIGWCLKKPEKNSYMANTRLGATLHSYKPTKREEDVCRKVGERMKKEGVYFIGLDLIGGKLSEVNITSPRLLLPDPFDLSPYEKMAQWACT